MDGESTVSSQDSCYGGASLAGAVIGTFLTTILLLAVAALLYKQWRRHKGKHLVLVTNPEIVEDAYAFDNPCFKDATPAVARNHDSCPQSSANLVIETSPSTKDSTRWSNPWSSLGFPSVNKNDNRRTLDDSCLGSKAMRVSRVSLRSRDFTGLGFNVCGNMREGIFVKDLLHRGPASESGRIHPGDRIGSVKISFRSMVYEDALTILSYASPYDVELEVESGCTSAGSRPTTLLKKTVGPSPSRICHPLYRSQSIPELSQTHKTTAKRLFIADPNDSIGSNYSTMNSTIKSSKSTPGNQTLERHHEDSKVHNNHHHNQNHHKFGIKVLPALDGTVHRIENQNEHNTNLERRNSRKIDIGNELNDERSKSNTTDGMTTAKFDFDRSYHDKTTEHFQKRENSRQPEPTATHVNFPVNYVTKFEQETNDGFVDSNGFDVPEKPLSMAVMQDDETMEKMFIPSDVPTEVHNAAMAARRNRKNSKELLDVASFATTNSVEMTDPKSPPKNKRKAPAPPKISSVTAEDGSHSRDSEFNDVTPNKNERGNADDTIESITDYAESLNDYVGKIRNSAKEKDAESRRKRLESTTMRRKSKSDSDTDSEVHDSFTTIELNPADITIHHTPVPRVDGEHDHDENDDDEDDVYRKAASLGDLSKYENKNLAILERAQSLDMADTVSKKRKIVAIQPDDINEMTEASTKLDNVDSFDRRKLKKSNEWGTLEDAIWKKTTESGDTMETRTRKRSNETLERSKSLVEIKLKSSAKGSDKTVDSSGRLVPVEEPDFTSIELYNLPLSMRLTREFIHTERMFNPDEDNSLARIVNNGTIVKSPTPVEMELDFTQATPAISDDEDEIAGGNVKRTKLINLESPLLNTLDNPRIDDEFGKALRYFDLQVSRSSINDEETRALELRDIDSSKLDRDGQKIDESMYTGREEVYEEPMKKVTVRTGCPGCDRKSSNHNCTTRSYDHDRNCTISTQSTKNDEINSHESSDSQLQKMKELPDSLTDGLSTSLSAFKIGLNRFERSPAADENHLRGKLVSPMESRIEKQLLRQHGVENEDKEEVGRSTKNSNNDVDEDLEEGYDFGSGVTINSKRSASSPLIDCHNISNVSVSSGENSEDSGLVGGSGDYGSRQDYDPVGRPPLPDTPMPKTGSPQKLTYITEIKVSTNGENVDNTPQQQQAEAASMKKDNVKPPRNDPTVLNTNGKDRSGKKPPVPPRRSDTSKLHSRDDHQPNDKQVLYVSEYNTLSAKDKNENAKKIAEANSQLDHSSSGNKKFENWIFLDDNKEQNPWGNDSSQTQPVTNIVVSSSGDDKKMKVHQ